MSEQSKQAYRQNLVAHWHAVKALLDAADPVVAAFMRANYRAEVDTRRAPGRRESQVHENRSEGEIPDRDHADGHAGGTARGATVVSYRYRPVLDRVPGKQTIRERAEFLAHEIHHDRLAPEAEIADAIEREIRRFAPPIEPHAYEEGRDGYGHERCAQCGGVRSIAAHS